MWPAEPMLLPTRSLPAQEQGPRQPSAHLVPPFQQPGSSQAACCWRNTGCHCLGETPTHISAPWRYMPGHLEGRREEGTAGAAAATAPRHGRRAQSPPAVPGPSSPPALGCTPSPNRLLWPPLSTRAPFVLSIPSGCRLHVSLNQDRTGLSRWVYVQPKELKAAETSPLHWLRSLRTPRARCSRLHANT